MPFGLLLADLWLSQAMKHSLLPCSLFLHELPSLPDHAEPRQKNQQLHSMMKAGTVGGFP